MSWCYVICRDIPEELRQMPVIVAQPKPFVVAYSDDPGDENDAKEVDEPITVGGE